MKLNFTGTPALPTHIIPMIFTLLTMMFMTGCGERTVQPVPGEAEQTIQGEVDAPPTGEGSEASTSEPDLDGGQPLAPPPPPYEELGPPPRLQDGESSQ